MAKYHDYVFDVEQRRFVGDFEKMYQDEIKEGFDSWHQDDSRWMSRQISLSLLNHWNFGVIIDLGCGKGQFTHLLKKKNNYVVGFDVSNCAVGLARQRYPDIVFDLLDLRSGNDVELAYGKIKKEVGNVNLTVIFECLSYIEDWKQLLERVAKSTEYILLSLYIPQDPIGFVKSESDLLSELNTLFEPFEVVSTRVSRFTIFFGKSRYIQGDE